ncbi:MAG: hypothetical protein HYS22_00025 [Deltaproteobacteria bacterium]|nr:hypothetical protein [Deltaproteobacteria bacterium]
MNKPVNKKEKERIKKILTVLLTAASLGACAGSKFALVYPGMTSQEVVKAMESGPSKVEQHEGNYATWYYGKDQCLLLKDDKVSTKSQTEEKTALSIPGLGGLSEKKTAECLPPGKVATGKVERSVDTPWGGLKH